MKKIISGAILLLVMIALVACSSKTTSDVNVGVGIDSADVDTYSKQGEGTEGAVTVAEDVTYDALNLLTGENNMASDRVGKRPIAVSVNNIEASWPQYGTSQADIIYEIETEGGITRLMCVFSDIRQVTKLGSVRSLRDQFMQCVYPFDAIIVHIGVNVYAKKYVSMYNYQTIDGDVVTSVFFTDEARRASGYASEHTKFTSSSAIYSVIDQLSFETDAYNEDTAFNFVDEGTTVVPTTGVANTVNYDFSSYYDGDFRYNADDGLYYKWQHGEQQMDAGNNEQLKFENLFIVLAPIKVIDDAGCVEVNYEAGGTAYYISEGHYEKCTWTKGAWSSNFTFISDETGEEIQVNTGKTHFAVIRTDYADSIVFGE